MSMNTPVDTPKCEMSSLELYERGAAAHKAGDYEESIKLLERCSEGIREQSEYWVYMGYNYFAEGDWEKARSSFNEAVRLGGDPGGIRGLGDICRQEGKWKEARECYRRTIMEYPGDEWGYVRLCGVEGAMLGKQWGKQELTWALNQVEDDSLFVEGVRGVMMALDEGGGRFSGHYYEWRIKRMRKVIEVFGAEWFRGKRILELGCGYGDMGMLLVALGADVMFSDYRQEHLDEMERRYPAYGREKLIKADINKEWPFKGEFDLVLHMGLLYHLEDWKYGLEKAKGCSANMVLETEVCDSEEVGCEKKKLEYGFDQAVSGCGIRPSAASIEAELEKQGCSYNRYDESELNSTMHRYDWKVAGTGRHGPGYRRLWICRGVVQ